jgi:hypothetical protein
MLTLTCVCACSCDPVCVVCTRNCVCVCVRAGGAADTSAFGLFELDDSASAGDEFMAVKPWIGAIVAPSAPPPAASGPPSASLDLEWVHGYSAQASRNSLRYCQTKERSSSGKGDIVYPAASLGVVYDLTSNRQRFLRNIPGNVGANDDVISLAVSPDGQFVAIGEIGKRANVVVFDVLTMTTQAVLTGHRRGVTEVAFSNDGTLLASVGLDDEHRVRVCARVCACVCVRACCPLFLPGVAGCVDARPPPPLQALMLFRPLLALCPSACPLSPACRS